MYAPSGIKQLLRSALTWKCCHHWQRRVLQNDYCSVLFPSMSLIRSRALEVSAPPTSFPVSEAGGLTSLWPAYFSRLRVALQQHGHGRDVSVSLYTHACDACRTARAVREKKTRKAWRRTTTSVSSFSTAAFPEPTGTAAVRAVNFRSSSSARRWASTTNCGGWTAEDGGGCCCVANDWRKRGWTRRRSTRDSIATVDGAAPAKGASTSPLENAAQNCIASLLGALRTHFSCGGQTFLCAGLECRPTIQTGRQDC
jgi:hypothetical protein